MSDHPRCNATNLITNEKLSSEPGLYKNVDENRFAALIIELKLMAPNMHRHFWKNAILPPILAEDDGNRTWKFFPAWLAVAFILRSTIALGSDFVIHPDEIMQYLEPAHRAVFGNGIVFWEYQYGARNWIIPGIVAAMLWVLDKIGLGVPWVYVYAVKMAFCALSLFVPWGAYHFVRRTLGGESAKFALVLTCLWPYLVVFAHKPYTEFVSTSLLFLALGLASRPAKPWPVAFVTGAVLALAGAVRMQYMPVAAIVWLAKSASAGRPWKLMSLTGAMAVAAFVALLETITWGAPFHSYYVNYVFNQGLDEIRERQSLFFYFPRLVFMTAGGALLVLYAFFRTPKRHMLAVFLTAMVLAVHLSQPHKENRFVFFLLPLFLVVAGDTLARWSDKLPAINLKATAVFSAIFLAVVASNLVDDQWIHDAASTKRPPVRYLFGQDNKHEAYLELSKLEDVQGVLHLGEPYFNFPGYYYLHHDVPLYDIDAFEAAIEKIGDGDTRNLVSHVVVAGEFPEIPGFVQIGEVGKAYSYGFVEGAGPVRKWRGNTPTIVPEDRAKIARQRLGHPETEAFPVFELADPED